MSEQKKGPSLGRNRPF